MTGPTRPRAPRSDATRNRERVLAAAERLFARRGLDATLDEVARSAGVGVGTVYRGFGSKEALQDAVLQRRLDAGADLLADCLRQTSAFEGLCTFLRRSVLMQAGDRGLHEFLHSLDGDRARFDRLRERMAPPLGELIERAQAEGALRADFRATDLPPLILMFSRLAHTDPEHGPALARRYLDMFLDGLAPAPARSPAADGLDDDTLGTWLTAVGRARS